MKIKKFKYLILPFITIPLTFYLFKLYGSLLYSGGYCQVLNYRTLKQLNLISSCNYDAGSDYLLAGAPIFFGLILYFANIINMLFYRRFKKRKEK